MKYYEQFKLETGMQYVSGDETGYNQYVDDCYIQWLESKIYLSSDTMLSEVLKIISGMYVSDKISRSDYDDGCVDGHNDALRQVCKIIKEKILSISANKVYEKES